MVTETYVTAVVVTVMRMELVVDVIEMVIVIDGGCTNLLLALIENLKILKLRCSEEEEGGAGSIKPGQEAKCTKCLKAPYLARHASFCAKCSEQVKKFLQKLMKSLQLHVIS